MKKSVLAPEAKKDLWDSRVEVAAGAAAKLCPVKAEADEAARKIVQVLEALSMGDRWGTALASVGWVWKEFSPFSFKNEPLKELLRMSEEFRATSRLIKLEDEAERRAVEGVEEDVFSPHGKKVGKRRVYSDALLVRLLKAAAPEKYSDSPQQHQGGLTLNVNLGDLRGPVQVAVPKKAIDVEAVEP